MRLPHLRWANQQKTAETVSVYAAYICPFHAARQSGGCVKWEKAYLPFAIGKILRLC